MIDISEGKEGTERQKVLKLSDGGEWKTDEVRTFDLGPISEDEALRFAADPLGRKPTLTFDVPENTHVTVPGTLIPVLLEGEMAPLFKELFLRRADLGFRKPIFPGEHIQLLCQLKAVRPGSRKAPTVSRFNFVAQTIHGQRAEVKYDGIFTMVTPPQD